MTARRGAASVAGRRWSLRGSTSPAERWSTVIDGHELQRLRRQVGLSQAKLADQAEVGMSTVARLERQCRARCRTWTLARIATALGLPQDALRLAGATDTAHAPTRAASLGDLEERLATYEHQRSLPGALAREFTDWEIEVNPGGIEICTAFWRSPDGRSRRVVVARSSGDLLCRLRAIGPVQP